MSTDRSPQQRRRPTRGLSNGASHGSYSEFSDV